MESIKSISIKPDNETCVSMNAVAEVQNNLLKMRIKISPSELNLMISVAVATIREMEKNHLTTYKGKLNDN